MGREILDFRAPGADRRVAYGASPSQFVDFRVPSGPGPHPIVMMIHGGFWRDRFDLLHEGPVCAALTASGFVTANVEYRRVGEPGGGWPGTFEDIAAALRCVRDHAAGLAADPQRIVVAGHSAGGHLALRLAADDAALQGVVALAPVACLVEAWELDLGGGAVADFLQASPDTAPDRYDAVCPSRRPAAVPRVLIHGDQDGIVPLDLSRQYLRLRAGDPAPVRLIELPGADHFDVIDVRSPAWNVVLGTVRALAAL